MFPTQYVGGLMSWTEDKVSQLRELWDQGLPTSQIGTILGFTKNAVVGKAHRIGLERRPSPIKRSVMKPNRKEARAPLMPKLNIDNKVENNFDNTLSGSDRNAKYLGKNSIISRKSIGCEWPIGEPNEPNFHYCGSKKLEGKSYCLEHCSKAYILPEKTKSEEVAA